MGLCLGAVLLNARWLPAVPWFPVAVAGILLLAAWLAERWWSGGLRAP